MTGVQTCALPIYTPSERSYFPGRSEKIFGKRPFPDHDHVMINSNGDTNEQIAIEAAADAKIASDTSSEDKKDTDIPA